MLKLDIQRDGRSLTLELPLDTGILDGQLRNIGIYEPMQQIPQSEFTLRPLNELGEHFMKIIEPEDSLWRIASYYNAPATLEHESRREMEALILADRFRSIDHISDYIEFGPDALDGLIRLTRDGRSVILPTTQINLYQCFGAETPMGLTRLTEAEVQPVSDFGRQLMAELQPYSDTIATLNEACSLAWDARHSTATPTQIMHSARIFQMPMDTEFVNFYCPLFVSEWDPGPEVYMPLEHSYLVEHEAEIREALQIWTKDKDNTEFLDDALQPKIASLHWEIERFGGEVYGKAVCEIRAPLTDAEQSELAQWLSADTSDGLLDNFGEYPIQTGDGDIYVSFFQYDGENYMLPEVEFLVQVLGESLDDQGFCGMGGMS